MRRDTRRRGNPAGREQHLSRRILRRQHRDPPIGRGKLRQNPIVEVRSPDQAILQAERQHHFGRRLIERHDARGGRTWSRRAVLDRSGGAAVRRHPPDARNEAIAWAGHAGPASMPLPASVSLDVSQGLPSSGMSSVLRRRTDTHPGRSPG